MENKVENKVEKVLTFSTFVIALLIALLYWKIRSKRF